MNGTLLTRFGIFSALATATMWGNTAPVVVIESAAMRPGTTYMDVVYRVEDPDDATVAVRAAAFVDGTRSLEKLLKPATFAEGTEANLGDAIATNVSHTLTWNAGADWDVTLGQVKFEVLAKDGRALAPINWITIPAVSSTPELTVSETAFGGTEVWDALLWLYLSGDTGIGLDAGKLVGTTASGAFSGLTLAAADLPGTYGPVYVLKKMNLMPANFGTEIAYADAARRITSPGGVWYAKNAPYTGTSVVAAWGSGDDTGQLSGMAGNLDIVKLVCGGGHALALSSAGTVSMWGASSFWIGSVPSGLDQVVDISTAAGMSLARKSDGSLVAWGRSYDDNIARPPADLGPVKAMTVGGGTGGQFGTFAAAVKPDGTVVAWGTNIRQQTEVPIGLSGVKSVTAGGTYTLALKEDGTVVGWGFSATASAFTPPAGLSDVIALSTTPYSAGLSINTASHSLALKSDGTVVAWGSNTSGQCDVPTDLTDVVAIAAGAGYSLALKADGTVVSWGANSLVPTNLTGVTAIAAGVGGLGYAVKTDSPTAE